MNHLARMGGTALLSFALLASFGCTKQETQTDKKQETGQTAELTISAAASLRDALTDIEKRYEAEHENVELTFNFGSSGALQQQIEQGAPVDLFFSAAEDKFGTLVDKGLIAKENGKNLLGNELVLVVPRKQAAVTGFSALKDNSIKQIAMGTPESVPAGKYAKQALTKMNLWKAVEGKMVYAKDVRQVLTYVETGNVSAGIVYKTDAQVSDKVKVVETAANSTHDPIVYPLGIIKGTKHKTEAADFYQYLQEKESLAIFQKYGFTIIQKSP